MGTRCTWINACGGSAIRGRSRPGRREEEASSFFRARILLFEIYLDILKKKAADHFVLSVSLCTV